MCFQLLKKAAELMGKQGVILCLRTHSCCPIYTVHVHLLFNSDAKILMFLLNLSINIFFSHLKDNEYSLLTIDQMIAQCGRSCWL